MIKVLKQRFLIVLDAHGLTEPSIPKRKSIYGLPMNLVVAR